MQAHIFVDNSNMFGGAQRAAETLEPNAPWLAVRLYYKHLFRLLENDHDVVTRVIAGSVPPGNESLWEYSRDAGYDTDLLRKVAANDGRLAEQSVDELLHLKIANVLLDYNPPQLLVLATGDGRVGNWGTSFLLQVERALKRKWAVEVWSWKEQLSGKYSRLAVPVGASLTVNELDPYYRRITFVQGGSYSLGTTTVTVVNRVVGKL